MSHRTLFGFFRRSCLLSYTLERYTLPIFVGDARRGSPEGKNAPWKVHKERTGACHIILTLARYAVSSFFFLSFVPCHHTMNIICTLLRFHFVFVGHASAGRTEPLPTPIWRIRRSGGCWKGRGAMAATGAAYSGGNGGGCCCCCGGGGAARVQFARRCRIIDKRREFPAASFL